MSDTPETDEAIHDVGENTECLMVFVDFARKLERERNGLHDLHNKNAKYSAELLEICGTLRKERNMYERQVASLIKRLGKTQERMIDAERICNKIYMARNITNSEESMLSALAEIDKTYRTKNDGN